MLPLIFDNIGSDDILKLVAEKNAERKTLEYKAKLNINTVDEKAEFLADISSFANASGGDIIYGISDERDSEGKATGIPENVLGLTIENADSELGRISQIIESGLQPRLPFKAKVISIPDRGSVILIRVPKSWDSPHMVNYANRTRFFARNGIVGRMQLDVRQIGAAFTEQRGIGERLRAWKSDRIAKAVAGETPVELKGATLLMHFVSIPNLNDEQVLPRIFDLTMFSGHSLFSLSADSRRYNADGLLLHSRNEGVRTGNSYVQVFREGHLEYGDSYALNPDGNGHIAGGSIEEKLIYTFGRAIILLKKLGTAEPVFTSVTLIGVKGMDIYLPSHLQSNGATSLPFDRDIIVCPDVQLQNLQEGEPYRSTLLPIVDAIWQAAGRERTPASEARWNERV